MTRPQIKICGITNPDDLRLAETLGADLLGFNFYPPSPRSLPWQRAGEMIRQGVGRAVAVGLFVNETAATIRRAQEASGFQIAQLHGDETPEECRRLREAGIPVIKALRIRSREDLRRAEDYEVDYYLLDAFHESLYGGTGGRFDWSWIGASLAGRRVFLAGGINPDTIEQALAAGLYGIDLCSGVERTPGVKDPDKMSRLFAKIDAYEY